MAHHLANTYKGNISTLKTNKCEKILKLKSQASVYRLKNLKIPQQSICVITATKVNPKSAAVNTQFKQTITRIRKRINPCLTPSCSTK